MRELIDNVIKWAGDKNLLHPENAPKQYLKIIEELGETCKEILIGDREKQKKELGDIMVTLIIYGKQLDKRTDPVYNKLDVYAKDRNIIKMLLWHLHGDNTNVAFSYATDLCNSLGFTPEECLKDAWDKISKRTGKTTNGVFIKDEAK